MKKITTRAVLFLLSIPILPTTSPGSNFSNQCPCDLSRLHEEKVADVG